MTDTVQIEAVTSALGQVVLTALVATKIGTRLDRVTALTELHFVRAGISGDVDDVPVRLVNLVRVALDRIRTLEEVDILKRRPDPGTAGLRPYVAQGLGELLGATPMTRVM